MSDDFQGSVDQRGQQQQQQQQHETNDQMIARVQAQMAALTTLPDRKRKIKDGKDKYAFWETQPVVQFAEVNAAAQDGPIDQPKRVADVKQQPYTLPEGFEWCTCNVSDRAECEEVFSLLQNNYVEDDDAMFRFRYSPDFLHWALQPPGFREDWHVGVRASRSRRLVAFISAVPATIQANERHLRMVEINFLCVVKKLRAKRLAPVLIKEITRRVNLQDVWQAAYTAGVVIPTPVATCRYWHRSLSPKKLIDIKFSALAPRMTMARTLKLYRLPDAPATPGLRPMRAADAPAVTALLNAYLSKHKLAQAFSVEEVAHWLVPRPGVVEAYVVEQPTAIGGSSSGSGAAGVAGADTAAAANGNAAAASSSSSGGGGGERITDLLSFYSLPSSVLGHPEHSELRAAYMYYTVAGSVPAQDLMQDALVLAKGLGYDVFNALDLMENAGWLRALKFGEGDGFLRYYLYNYRLAGGELQPSDLALILL